MCIYNCNKYRGERFTFLVNVEFYISQKFFLSQKLRLQQNSPIWISTYLSISHQLTYILAIQTIKTVPYLSSVISCRNGIRQGRSRMTLKAMVLQWLNFWAQVCTLTRKKQAIRTLYIIITLFWLDNFGVWEQKSYLNVLTVRHVHWTANQITVYNKYFVLMGQFWSASIKIVLESFDRKACLLTFDIYQGYNVDRCHVD